MTFNIAKLTVRFAPDDKPPLKIIFIHPDGFLYIVLELKNTENVLFMIFEHFF
jgi:hypothetical protein